MCEPSLTWNLVAMITALAFISLIVADLLLRYLDNGGRGLVPWRAIFSLFFLFPETTTFQSVDEKHRQKP
jgi:hypothetical protein